MWQELTLLHLTRERRPAEALPRPMVWRTCLRELHFLPPGERSGDPAALRGLAAHRLLVEICSGLHSPLLGETEVLGQFRVFREAQSWPAEWREFLEAVEEDVRKVRRAHLHNVGSHSYGSLARRHLPPSAELVLVGAGRLARDLLPWLASHRLTILARNPERAARDLGVGAGPLHDTNLPRNASWLIAAPVDSGILTALWARSAPELVLDFRGEGELGSPPRGVGRYLGLGALFSELEANRQEQQRIREQAIRHTQELGELRARRAASAMIHRPFGWEDAFA